jgi:hypothetical protein
MFRADVLPREVGESIVLLRSTVIPQSFSHGFTTRAGGVSPAEPHRGLNLGLRWGDPVEHVHENRRRLLAATGAARLHLATQVHGRAVRQVVADDSPVDVAGSEADAVVTDVVGAAVAVLVADCVPVLIADAEGGACAAVHAGWRGVIAGAVPAALQHLARAFGTQPAAARVALGPCIGPCCFEVGPEVERAFADGFSEAREHGIIRTPAPGGRAHVDLRAALRLSLRGMGVPAHAIDVSDACTRCDPERRFYSYRRDGRTGQQAGFIVPPRPTLTPASP